MILSEPLNTLFVTLPGAYLAKDHENVVVKVDQEERVRVPLHHVCLFTMCASLHLVPPYILCLLTVCASLQHVSSYILPP